MTDPFGHIHMTTSRPSFEPIDRGEWEPYQAYMEGDTAYDFSGTWRCLRDHRSGLYPPTTVHEDFPNTIWAPDD